MPTTQEMTILTNITQQGQYIPSLLTALDPGESTEVEDAAGFEGHPCFEISEGAE